jgi:hypothetical protein
MGEEEHKLFVLLLRVKYSLMKRKFLLKTCFLKEEMVLK